MKYVSESNSLSSYYSDFLDTILVYPTGEILSIRDSISNGLKMTPCQLENNYFNDSLLHEALNNIQDISEECGACIVPDSLNQKIAIAKSQPDSLTDAFRDLLQATGSWASGSLGNITPGTFIETYLLESYSAIISVLSGDFDREDIINQMSPIAELCPEEFGPGVFLARSVLNYVGVHYSFNDQEICYPPLRKSNPHQNSQLLIESQYTLAPNPSFGNFMISSEKDKISNSQVIITDISGRNVPYKLQHITEFKISVDLINITPGTYFVNLTGNGLNGFNSKLTIFNK